MAIEVLEKITQGYPVGKAKYTFLLFTTDDLNTLKQDFPHGGPAVDASIAVDWITGTAYALGDNGWIQGG